MQFNLDKCHVMHLGQSNVKKVYFMEDNDTRVQLSSTSLEKDLGVNIDDNLYFTKHTNIQVNKANRIYGLIRRSYIYLGSFIV